MKQPITTEPCAPADHVSTVEWVVGSGWLVLVTAAELSSAKEFLGRRPAGWDRFTVPHACGPVPRSCRPVEPHRLPHESDGGNGNVMRAGLRGAAMRVKLFANLAETVGRRTVEIPLEDETSVEDILERLFERHPSLREDVLNTEGVPADHINLLIDGETIPQGAAGLDERVSDANELAIFPPVTGG